MDILEILTTKRVDGPARGERDAITLFKGSLETQIKKIDAIKKDPSTEIAVTNWFKAYNGGYRVHLGKTPIELKGGKYWQLDGLAEAREFFVKISSYVDTDKDFQQAIRDAKQAEDAKRKAAGEAPKKRGRKAKPV